MTEKRIQFKNIVKNQLPQYVREEFPLVSEFLSQYYLSQEYQGASLDLLQNIDKYIKLNEVTNLKKSSTLQISISYDSDSIIVDDTTGFPDSYGLLKIGDEIITYTGKTFSTFTGCIRGFSGVSSYQNNDNPEELVFERTFAEDHTAGDVVENLSVLFLVEFLKKVKKQFLPGFEGRDLAIKKVARGQTLLFDEYPLDENIFIKQSRDFYSSKGTDRSFKILFSALYAEDVEVIKPKEFLFRPSDAGYRVTNDLVVESVSGDVFELKNLTLRQDSYNEINTAYSPVTRVERLNIGTGTKDYYQVSLDSGYDRDIRVDGATYGKFSIHPKTKNIGQVSIGQTFIDVDSTLGFPSNGELFVTYPSGNSAVITYTSKTITQFLGCSNITETIPDNSVIDINTFAYANVGLSTNKDIKVKIRSVLNSLNFDKEAYYYSPETKVKIKNLGVSPKDIVSNNWYFNTSPTYKVKKIEFKLSNNYTISLFDQHSLKINDNITLSGSDGSSYSFKVVKILSEVEFDAEGSDISNLNASYTVKRNRLKPFSSKYSISNFDANVQNTYKLADKTLVASSSLPYYSKPLNAQILSYDLDGLFKAGDTFTITNNIDHGFYTGDAVYYTPEKIGDTVISSLFDEGIYYVKRVNQNDIKLSRSKSDLSYDIFIKLLSEKFVSKNKLELLKFKGKTLSHQKLLREISKPINDGKIYPTTYGQTGILVNGVEILNYKSTDFVYYGNLEKIEVVSGGKNYDIINNPQLVVKDQVGTGATGFCAVKGNLKEIKIIDSGFDYVENPVIKISGGNGTDATAVPILTDKIHSVYFNSELEYGLVNITNNTIGFSTYHKFRNNESVIYKTFSQDGIVGLSTDSRYYISTQNSKTIKLYKTFDDSVLGINTISLTGYGKGRHAFESVDKKKVVTSIKVVNGGSGYENKKRTCPPTAVDTALGTITIKDHDYKSGEIITYVSTGSSIGGLSSSEKYYVTTIDNDTFRLSNVGITTNNSDFFYKTKQYINFTNIGIGTHTFNYPEITVEVLGEVGISSVSDSDFKCKVQPIFSGEITSVHLVDGGVGYGSSEIINFIREPEVTVSSGSGGVLYPVISSGKILEVFVNDGGSSYTSPPELIVDGDGIGATLTATLTDGKITSVKIINSGAGYTQNLTTIKVIAPGSGVKFKSKIKSWNVNLFEKYFQNITEDDGILANGINRNYGLQYCHTYAPRELRKSLYSTISVGDSLIYNDVDLKVSNTNEVNPTSQSHSPIIGWAYDGNPIYGPYGYATKNGGSIVKLQSGYKKVLKPNRPSFREGFFVEDFEFFPSTSDLVLDENNGRFCKTPEFPNGVYAYFATFEDDLDSTGPFRGYRRPKFPYLIGTNYNSKPNIFNFHSLSNQDNYNLNDGKWLRNSSSYALRKENTSYDYLLFPNKLKEQISTIKVTSSGSIENIGISSGGINYQVGDEVLLDLSDNKGQGFKARVSHITGKEVNSISLASTTILGVEFYPLDGNGNFIGFSTLPHGLNNFDLIKISGLSTSSSLMEGFYRIGITTNNLLLSGVGTTSFGISSTGVTGIVTYISVKGGLSYPDIRENDILKIDQERVKVLNVDTLSSRIRVLRQYDGTIGVSHTASTPIYEITRKLNVNVGYRTSFSNVKNKEIYFDPIESLGIGTIAGVGIGSTIKFSNPGAGLTEFFVPTKTIYVKDHGLETGDIVIYNSNSGSPIAISTNGVNSVNASNDQRFYVFKVNSNLIGISSVKVGLGSTGTVVGVASTTANQSTLYFTGVGTGVYHSFKTEYSNILSGRIDKNLVTVSVAETHGLTSFDTVTIEVNPSIATTFYVQYNETNRRIVLGSKTFTPSDVNIVDDSIKILNHGLYTGQVVIHKATSPSGGLENEKLYYVYVVDNDNIKLTNTLYDATSLKPLTVSITSASNGSLLLVNPHINVYKNSTVVFDLTDSSLSHIQNSSLVPSFDLNIFVDKNFTQKYESIEDKNLVLKKIGVAGVTTDAKVTLSISDATPKILYYNLNPVNIESIPSSKLNVSVDNEVYQNNSIFINESLYNGTYDILVSSGSSFTYNLKNYPEKNNYEKTTSSIKYYSNSNSIFGSIEKINISDGGFGFDVLPGISSVKSKTGSGSILQPESSSIGLIKKVKLQSIGFDYPSDFTMRPTAKLPEILDVEPLSSFDSIGVTSVGVGYAISPKLIVIDGITKKVIKDVDLRYDIKNQTVTILQNTKGLFAVPPTIIPIENSNGVGISSISYNSSTKDVTAFLSVGFTTVGGFPFSINDKILIENVAIVGGSSTYRGYNSENYDYELFTIKSINPNYGGFGASIVYNLDGFLSSGEEPGEFNSLDSSARVIAEKNFPIFNPTLKKNNFILGEEVTTLEGDAIGKLNKWNSITEYATIETSDDFEVGKILVGKSSDSQALIKKSFKSDADYKLDYFSSVSGEWSNDAGFLNDNVQRIQDSFYYQNFSYSLKSKIDYDTWNDPVSNLNHTVGFKKFSDYQLESSNSTNLMTVRTENETDIDLKVDLIGNVDLNCVYNFDFVSENALQLGSKLVSDEIKFKNSILTDYVESVGNRVLVIDDISNRFNSNPRPDQSSIVHRIAASETRAQKYIIYTRDKRYVDERQLTIASFLLDNNNLAYLSQYGVESLDDLGSYDISFNGTDLTLEFYPIKYQVNNYDITTISYNLRNGLTSVGSSSFGPVSVATSSILVPTGTTTTIVGIATTYTSSKLLVEMSTPTGLVQYDEVSLIHDGADVKILQFGQINNISVEDYVGVGLGTYSAYISGSKVNLDFTPNAGIAATVNLIGVSLGDSSFIGTETYAMRHVLIGGNSTSIGSSTSPIANTIGSYPEDYDAAYFIVQVSDTTNNRHQISEVLIIDNELKSQTFQTEYAVLQTSSGLGTVGSNHSTSTNLTFTPIPNIDVEVKVYMNAFRYNQQNLPSQIEFNNAFIETDYAEYFGTNSDIRRAFDLYYESNPIFQREFLGNDISVVDIDNDTIKIPNHFFVTGEKLTYTNAGAGSTQSIGIGTTSIVGIGTTDKLPSSVYAIKIDDKTIKLASSAENALKSIPSHFNITSVGIGTSHTFTAHNQNNKVLITLDNNIQSPIVSTSQTTSLAREVISIDDVIYFTGISSFFGGDLVKIGDEILQIEGVGIGSTNGIRVKRSWLGTNYAGYSTGTLVTKVTGNYNIVGNTLNFVSAPYGNIPLTTSTAAPDSRDWIGISTGSKFHGRVFMRSGAAGQSIDPYHQNYIFDDISNTFTGIANTFRLKSSQNSVTGISTDNAIILINEIFQSPVDNYFLTESSGETNLSFVGTARTVGYDVGISSFPRGGIIVSVGSSAGLGYQPLVSAGGTAVVSVAGTIQSISIGNSGSGYRSIQTVNVGVSTFTTGNPTIHFIGTATISNGSIVSVAITNPGTGYTSSNPPYVIFDDPLSYTNIPLVYSNASPQGLGTFATIDIVVGQGSSVIDFELQSTGYGYKDGEILTVPVGGVSGIPTTSGYVPFELYIDKTISDKFSGWTLGELQRLDPLDRQFNGQRKSFQLTYDNELITILSSPGSLIKIESTLLVFINDILQIPNESYVFDGGSVIVFREAPKEGDTSKIIFYKGSGAPIDVIDREILDTVKVGDTLTIGYNPSIGQSPTLQEEERIVTRIDSVNLVSTNPYYGPGNVDDPFLLRPVKWCRQTEDLIIDSKVIGKSRELYEASINPSAYLIKSIGTGSTQIFVDNIRPFFNPINETNSTNITAYDFQRDIIILSQNTKVSASATAVVSAAGTISSVVITDGGVGYTTSPVVSIAGTNGIGMGETTTALALASISNGSVVSIAITNPGSNYSSSNPPVVLIESPNLVREKHRITSYEGDFGIITGISAVSVGVASTGVVFDLLISKDSFLRDSSITGVTTISGIQTGYYFVVYNSNVGNGVTSLDSNGSVIGIGTAFLDNVYEAVSVSIATTSTVGFGITYVAKVTVSLANYNSLSGLGFSGFYGEYSWGRLVLGERAEPQVFDAYTSNGVSGIQTGSLIIRENPLRYKNYIT